MTEYYSSSEGVLDMSGVPEEARGVATVLSAMFDQMPAFTGSDDNYLLSWTSKYYLDLSFSGGQMQDWTATLMDGSASKGWDATSLNKFLERQSG